MLTKIGMDTIIAKGKTSQEISVMIKGALLSARLPQSTAGMMIKSIKSNNILFSERGR